MADEQVFASFVLDQKSGLEMALPAERVFEATVVTGRIQPLPAGVEFVEGLMRLRGLVIPVLNLKRRLKLSHSTYPQDAKVAVVEVGRRRFGLLFDDIKEVFRVEASAVSRLPAALQSDDGVISGFISQTGGVPVVELLDLDYLFHDGGQSLPVETVVGDDGSAEEQQIVRKQCCSRYVIFECGGQEFGVKVEHAQELSFISGVDELYRDGNIEGALQLRDHIIPVLDANALLTGCRSQSVLDPERRVLVLISGDLVFGFIVDKARGLVTVPENEILPMPLRGKNGVNGIFPYQQGRNIMLLDVDELIHSHSEQLKAIGRIRRDETGKDNLLKKLSHNLITENCYLIFSIGKHFAVEIKDVQEIIEFREGLHLPAGQDFSSSVINLRGEVIPVVNLRSFYNFPEREASTEPSRLIVCRGYTRPVALEVDSIITIYRQEKYYKTPSLKPQLSARKDTLDRLIVYQSEAGDGEHVLVVNVHQILQQHLGLVDDEQQ